LASEGCRHSSCLPEIWKFRSRVASARLCFYSTAWACRHVPPRLVRNSDLWADLAAAGKDVFARAAALRRILQDTATFGNCGGSCSCGTCHAYIDPAWLARLPPPDQTEVGMLEYIIDPLPNSRLTCQLRLTDKLDGLTLRLPRTQI
jgi:ferredoxin